MSSHQVGAGGSKLKKLWFFSTNLKSVSPEVLVGAIKRFEEVLFYTSRITPEQITPILTMVKEDQQGRLKHIEIFNPFYGKYNFVSPTLIQEALLNNTVKISVII